MEASRDNRQDISLASPRLGSNNSVGRSSARIQEMKKEKNSYEDPRSTNNPVLRLQYEYVQDPKDYEYKDTLSENLSFVRESSEIYSQSYERISSGGFTRVSLVFALYVRTYCSQLAAPGIIVIDPSHPCYCCSIHKPRQGEVETRSRRCLEYEPLLHVSCDAGARLQQDTNRNHGRRRRWYVVYFAVPRLQQHAYEQRWRCPQFFSRRT